MPTHPWLYRLRRAARSLLAAAPPVADGFTPAGGAVLVLAPHPDDEIIGCGGTLRRHVLAGDPAAVVYLTRGEGSRGFPWLSSPQRQQVRMAEARAGCRLLGVDDLTFLDAKDGGCGEPEELVRLKGRISALLAERRPRRVYVPHADDSHPDHRAAFRAATEALAALAVAPAGGASTPAIPCELVQYEVWSPMRADYAVDVTAHTRLKLRALRRHRLALDAFDYVETVRGLSRYRCGTLLQRRGYAEAFRRT